MANTGWVGPGLPDPDGRYLFTSELKTDNALIVDSMIQILLTRQRERVGNPTFGSQLYLIPFDPMTVLSEVVAEQYVRDALARWEPRASVSNVVVQLRPDTHEIAVQVDYTINRTGQPGTFTVRMTL